MRNAITPPHPVTLSADTTTRPMLCTAKEAQAELCVSRTALYLLINAGRIKTVKIGTGNRFRIPRAELDRFVRDEAA